MAFLAEKEDILKEWLGIDLHIIANKAGFTRKKSIVSRNLIYRSIRYLDYETCVNKTPDINAIIGLVALMWEHIDREEFDIKDLIIVFLSRIGYSSSAIICDKKFKTDECMFSQMNSFVYQLSSSLNQMRNEVNVGKKKFILSDFQKELWDSIDEEEVVGISAPTSAGKSFVILWKLLSILISKKIDIVYVVPTLSLINQVTRDFSSALKELDFHDYHIVNTYEEKGKDGNYIYVLTQEKAIAAFYDDSSFNDNLILVVDEIQNIERVDDPYDERAKTLFDTMIEFRRKKNVEKVIISGPRINKIGSVGRIIFGKKTNEHSTETSPVLSLTYSIKKIGQKYYFKQYTSLIKNSLSCEIENSSEILGYGKKQYDDSYMGFFNSFLANTGEKQNIIFAPTAKQAREIALSLNQVKEAPYDLIEYYENTVNPNYSLCQTLKNGICYHHGKMPAHVRRTLERAIIDKKISNVVCTTTLLQGVNLPAQNVYIRNPHLYIKKRTNSAELTNYEMANLRGRAGRLLKDFVGRTFVMDENGFSDTEGYKQEELFEETTKSLPTSYEKTFENNKNSIEKVLSDGDAVTDEMMGYGHLVTYIRQNVLRYGSESRNKMKEVGISLTKDQVAAIKAKLDQISIPVSICKKNRYWDPVVLDIIYRKYNGGVPKTIYEKNIKNKIDGLFEFLRDTPETRLMFYRHIPEKFGTGRGKAYLINMIFDWTRGVPLKNVFSTNYYSGEDAQDRIEDTIKVLENTVSYDIPLLLKPIFDIKDPEGSFLSSIQVGATDAMTRKMIEMGVPRDTAITLMDDYFELSEKTYADTNEVEGLVLTALSRHYDKLPYWIKIQVDYLIS